MTEPVNVGLAFRVSEELQSAIAAVDPRVQVFDLSALGGRSEPGAEARPALLQQIANLEVICGPNSIPAEYFDAATNLRWFQAINAGVDNMQRRGLLNRDFQVTTAAGLAAVPIAEYAIGVMVMLARDLHTTVKDQMAARWQFHFAGELSGKTLGIVGLGEIGRETARRARAFNMRVIATRRSASGASDADCDELIPYADLGRLIEQSDYLLLAVPLTPETHHLIGAAELARMKPSAFLVNVARGEVVDQPALIDALQSGRIAGAALDVFDPEPLPTGNPLWAMPNVIVTPHNAGAVEGYGHRATGVFIANLRRYLAGEPLSHVVNPALGY